MVRGVFGIQKSTVEEFVDGVVRGDELTDDGSKDGAVEIIVDDNMCNYIEPKKIISKQPDPVLFFPF